MQDSLSQFTKISKLFAKFKMVQQIVKMIWGSKPLVLLVQSDFELWWLNAVVMNKRIILSTCKSTEKY